MKNKINTTDPKHLEKCQTCANWFYGRSTKRCIKHNPKNNGFIAYLTDEGYRRKLELKGTLELSELLDLNIKLNQLGFIETCPIGCHRYFDNGEKSAIVKATVESFGFQFVEVK